MMNNGSGSINPKIVGKLTSLGDEYTRAIDNAESICREIESLENLLSRKKMN